MEKRPIPGTNLRTSIVGMGCWAMGGKYWGSDITDEDSEAAVQEALAQGINFFDTSVGASCRFCGSACTM